MTDDDDQIDREFDRVVGPSLAAARAEDARLPEGLTARVLADAARVQAEWQEAAWREAPAMRVPFWRQIMGALGGVPALGGLMAACAGGVWLGVAPPQNFDPAGYVMNSSSVLSFYADVQASILDEEGL